MGLFPVAIEVRAMGTLSAAAGATGPTTAGTSTVSAARRPQVANIAAARGARRRRATVVSGLVMPVRLACM